MNDFTPLDSANWTQDDWDNYNHAQSDPGPIEKEKPTIKVLGPKQGYVEILNFYTQQKLDEEAKGPRRYNPLRPSSAGKSARELAYEYMEYKGYATYESEPIDAELDRLFKLGQSIEKDLIYQFKEAFKRADGELELRYTQQVLSFFTLHDGTRIEGSCDLVIIPKSKRFGGCVADAKSKKDKFSAAFKTNWEETKDKLSNMQTVQVFGDESYWVEDLPAFLEELNDYFFAQNFLQLNMYFFDEDKFLRSRGVDHAAIFQYNKNDSRVREIRFKPSQELYEYVKNKFQMVAKIVDETKDPTQVPREHTLGSPAVAFSKYRKIDYPDADALKEYFNTLPKKKWPKDTNRLKCASEIEYLFYLYEAATEYAETLENYEQKIVTLLEQEDVNKVKLENGNVYQMKYLKSGGPGGKGAFVLRRSKM
jgi:hypothetical protein